MRLTRLVMLLAFLGGPSWLLAGDASRVTAPVYPAATKGEACVEPTPVMRRRHMDFLDHRRDDTVIRGVRTPAHSLVGCIDCHAARDDAGQFVPVNAEGQFCASCHEYAGVRMDCFSCHATVPEADR